eukprot:CAMPEP_0170612864 /NCGR_PEP_ID=MMETSP0224-20130122/23956_1 /TAXON_ID=285029 /ORGANISM="Togula jolla, Strain CCCM 725" /LENGTH=311 /DNA_ID=CAMNT_0010938407 /DNA_START=90 /DNA_END=1025 /DNA_ORIENTATION=-
MIGPGAVNQCFVQDKNQVYEQIPTSPWPSLQRDRNAGLDPFGWQTVTGGLGTTPEFGEWSDDARAACLQHLAACSWAKGPRPCSAVPMEWSRAMASGANLGRSALKTGTMKSQLQVLQHEDDEAIFITRRINRLGFGSSELLRAYFGAYGTVKRIHVSHSRAKCGQRQRVRAGALGFVVMASREARARIIADGPEHLVTGVSVLVEEFQNRRSLSASVNEGSVDEGTCCGGTGDEQEHTSVEEDLTMVDMKMRWGRNMSEQSTVSTAASSTVSSGRSTRGTNSHAVMFYSMALAQFSEQDLHRALPEKYDD